MKEIFDLVELHVERGVSPTEQRMQVLGNLLKAVIDAADVQSKQAEIDV
jgi:hypothetical protein